MARSEPIDVQAFVAELPLEVLVSAVLREPAKIAEKKIGYSVPPSLLARTTMVSEVAASFPEIRVVRRPISNAEPGLKLTLL